MEKNKLVIPVNVVNQNDFISGFGGKEMGISAVALVIGVIVAVVCYAVNEAILTGIALAAGIIGITILSVKRDRFNESLIDKIRFVRVYYKSQKKYEYEYYNIYERVREYGKGRK